MNDDPASDVLRINLGCRAGERLAIVTDTGPFAAPTDAAPDRPTLAHWLAAAGERLGLETRVVTYEPPARSGVEPPADVFAAVYPEGFVDVARERGLLEPLVAKTIDAAGLRTLSAFLADAPTRVDVLLVLSRYSVTHTRFRKLLTETGRVRAATMPGVEPGMFSGVMTADWPTVAARSQAVAALLSAADAATIHTAGNRELRFGLAGRGGLADTGILNEPGAFGNLPGGEAFIAPLEGTAVGRVAVGPREDPGAGEFRFAAGQMVAAGGDVRGRDRLDEAIDANPLARNLAELGVGTNEKATAPDNILEAEKILGTIHLALGDNASFGGTVAVPFHQDYVVYRPTLVLHMADGTERTVLDEGRFLIEP